MKDKEIKDLEEAITKTNEEWKKIEGQKNQEEAASKELNFKIEEIQLGYHDLFNEYSKLYINATEASNQYTEQESKFYADIESWKRIAKNVGRYMDLVVRYQDGNQEKLKIYTKSLSKN